MGYTIRDATVRMVRVIDADLAEYARPFTLAALHVDPCAPPSKRYTLTSYSGITSVEPVWALCLTLDMPAAAILHHPIYEAHVILEDALIHHRLMLAKSAADAAWLAGNR